MGGAITPYRPVHFLADLPKMLPTIPLKRMATHAAAKSYACFGISVSVCSFLTLSARRKRSGTDGRAQENGLKNVSSHKPFSESDKTVERVLKTENKR